MSSESDSRSAVPAKTTIAPAKTLTIDFKPYLWSAKAIPHAPQYGDPYSLIGDCYDRIATADEWEIPDP